MTGPFASSTVSIKTYQRDGGNQPPPPSGHGRWAEALREWAVVTVDDGWLRLLGAGGHGLPPLLTPAQDGNSSTSRLILGFDVLGGTFALGEGVEYFAPDGLEWFSLGLAGLGEFVEWTLAGGLDEAFEELRWSTWRSEIRFLAPDQGVSAYPPLWSEQGQDIARCTRGVTPLLDLVAAHHDAAAQLKDVGDGEQVTLDITD